MSKERQEINIIMVFIFSHIARYLQSASSIFQQHISLSMKTAVMKKISWRWFRISRNGPLGWNKFVHLIHASLIFYSVDKDGEGK